MANFVQGLCCGCAARPERRGGSGRPPRASSAHRAVAGRRDAGGEPPWRGLPALSRRAGGGRAMGSLEEVGVCPSLHRPAGGKGALASSEGRALPSLLGSSFLEVQTRRDSLSYAALPLARRPGFRGRAIASCSAGTSKEEVSHSKSSPGERALGPEVHLGSHVPRPSWMALGHRQTPARGAECGSQRSAAGDLARQRRGLRSVKRLADCGSLGPRTGVLDVPHLANEGRKRFEVILTFADFFSFLVQGTVNLSGESVNICIDFLYIYGKL